MGDKLSNYLKKTAKRVLKRTLRVLAIPLLIVTIVIVLLASCVYFITIDDGTYREGDWSSVPFAAADYRSGATVTENGEITTERTAQELWDEMLKNNSRVDEYLSGPDSLAKLMNAEMITQFPDMRENPDEEINWDDIDLTAGNIQGIVKFKRHDKDGNVKTLTATDEDTFYGWIEEYCSTGNETAKQNALSHFIVKQQQGNGTVARSVGEGDYVVKTDASNAAPTLTKAQLENALRQWTSGNMQTNALSVLDKVIEIQDNYKINALFIYALLRQESGIGTANSSWVRENNWTSLTALGHVHYSSPQDNLEQFVQKTICGSYYFNVGRISVQQIGEKYCADPPPPEWANGVISYMSEIYNLAGVTASSEHERVEHNNTDTYTDISDRILRAARSTPSPGVNLCQKWVRQVYANAGLGNRSFATAYEAFKANCVSTSKDNIPVGAAVYGTGKNSHGAGHVGIYIGDGKVMDNVGTIKTSSLEEWISWQSDTIQGNQGWLGWGWQAGAPKDTQTVNNTGENVDESTDSSSSQNSSDTRDGEIRTKANKHCIEVATWTQVDTTVTTDDPREQSENSHEYSMTTTTVNYQDMIDKYTMPFDFLWALLVVGESENFVLDLADLVYNSKIEVSICDNYTKNTDVDVKTYTKEDKNHVNATVTETTYDISASDEFDDYVTTNYTTTKTVVTQTNTLAIALTRADVWIVDYKVNFNQGATNTNTTTDRTTEPDEDFPNSPTSESDAYEHQKIGNLVYEVTQQAMEKAEEESSIPIQTDPFAPIDQNASESVNRDRTVISEDTVEKDISVKTYTRNKDIVHNITNTVETTEYTKGPATTKEKVDTDLDTPPNFVKIFNNPEYHRNRSNIRSASEWLFEILEINDDTKNMVDLTKYLLYKATGSDYGVDEFDFSTYNPEEFTSAEENNVSNSGSAFSGNFPRYYQCGQVWSGMHYNSGGTIATDGCGACALAMAVTGLTGQNVTPDIIVTYLNSIGTNTVYNGAGSAQKVAEKYGLTYQRIDRTDKTNIDKALNEGKVCIFSINGNGIYRGTGHFIMCYKKQNDKYYVLESARFYNENTGYNYNQVFSPGNQGVFVLGK